MNSPSHQSRWPRILVTFAAIIALSFGLLAWCIYDVVTLSPEATRLKRAFLSATGKPQSTTVQLSAGPWILGVARLVVGQIKDVPPEARHALRSLRSVSVGVYRLDRSQAMNAAALEFSDARMRLQGWRRAVGVRDGGTTVLIYTPEKVGHGEKLKVCLAVLENRDLVLVSGTISGRYLLPLISDQLERSSKSMRSVEQI